MCASCSAANRNTARFCSGCGAALAVASFTAGAGPAAFMPPLLALENAGPATGLPFLRELTAGLMAISAGVLAFSWRENWAAVLHYAIRHLGDALTEWRFYVLLPGVAVVVLLCATSVLTVVGSEPPKLLPILTAGAMALGALLVTASVVGNKYDFASWAVTGRYIDGHPHWRALFGLIGTAAAFAAAAFATNPTLARRSGMSTFDLAWLKPTGARSAGPQTVQRHTRAAAPAADQSFGLNTRGPEAFTPQPIATQGPGTTVSPRSLPPGYQTGDIGPRIGAALIDGLVGSAVSILGWIVFVASLNSNPSVAISFLLGFTFIGMAIGLWNVWWRQGKTGQSLGKERTNLRLVRSNGTAVNRSVVFGRLALAGLFSNLTCGIFGIVDIIVALTDPNHQRLVDRMLGLHVVNAKLPTGTVGTLREQPLMSSGPTTMY